MIDWVGLVSILFYLHFCCCCFFLLQNLAETVLNANGLRAAVAGFTIETTDDTAAQQRILNLIEEQYVVSLQISSC